MTIEPIGDIGNATLSEAVGFPTNVGVIDGHEDGELAEYQQDTGQFSISSSQVFDGTYSASGVAAGGTGTPYNSPDSFIYSTNLDSGNYPGRGYEFTWDWYFNGIGQGHQAVIFCVQDANNYYYAGAHNNQGNYVVKVKNGSVAKQTTVSAASGIYDPQTWYEGTVQIRSGGTIEYFDNNSSQNPSITDTEWDSGGFGWVAGGTDGSSVETFFDDARVTASL